MTQTLVQRLEEADDGELIPFSALLPAPVGLGRFGARLQSPEQSVRRIAANNLDAGVALEAAAS